MVKKLVIVGLFILLVVAPVVAVHGQTQFETYCTQKLEGSYSFQSGWDVCTIPVGKSSVLPLGDTFALMANQSITIEGTLTVNGTLNIEGGHLVISGTLNNFGAITNKTVPTAQGYGVKNYGTLNNNGALTIWVGSELWNYRVLNNYSLSLTVSGKLHNTATGQYNGSFTNQENARLSLTDSGYFRATPGTTNTNYGEILVGTASYSNAEFIIDPTLTNHGEIVNKGSFAASHLINQSTGKLFNEPWADWTCTGGSPYSTLINRGQFTNSWMTYIIDNCIFTNESSGTFTNHGHTILGNDKGTSIGYGKMYNHGTVINRGSIFLTGWPTNADVRLFNDNGAVIANFSGSVIELGNSSQMYNTGLIEHSGVIRPGSTGSGHLINYKWDNVNDPGVINLHCGGSITVTYSGPKWVDLCCTPPEVTSHPASTVITYGQNATFSVAGTNYTSVQWQEYVEPSWTNISGATLMTYTLTKPAVSMTGRQYRAVLTSDCGYPAISNPAILTVNKATPVVDPWPTASAITYGQELSASTLSGGNANVEGSFAFTDGKIIPDAGAYEASVTFTPNDVHNYNTIVGTVTVAVKQPILEVTEWPTASGITYGQALNESSLSGGKANIDGSFAFKFPEITPVAGTYSAVVTFTPDDTLNFDPVDGTINVTVIKAQLTFTASSFTVIYGDPTPTLTYQIDGFVLEDTANSAFTGAPDFSTTYTASTPVIDSPVYINIFLGNLVSSNYTFNFVRGTITINKADPVCSIVGYNGVYDGNSHGASGLATGVKGETLAGLNLGAKFTNVPGGTANWTFTDVTGNYNDASGSAAIVISKADATIVVNGKTAIYDGNEHGASGSATGVKGETLAGLDLGESFTNVPGGTANWTFTDVNCNYKDESGSVQIVINKATPVVSTWPTASAITYGQALSASVLDGGSANVNGSFAFTDDTITPNAGIYPAGVQFVPEDEVNYLTVSRTVDVTVNKATPRVASWPNATAITFGQALSASALTGGSADVAGSFAFADGTITPDAGTYSASVIFTPEDEGNYNTVSGSVDVTVNKAEASIVVDGATVIYDGEEHGANGSATGVKGEALAGLDLGAKFTNVPGGTANWTFTDRTGNYNDASGSVAIVINKANATIYVFGTTVTYTGNEVGASGYAFGVNYETLAELYLGEKFTNVPGGTANWRFNDVTGNYNNASGSVEIVITKANPSCGISGYTGVYDGESHGASGSCTGVKAETLTTLNLGGTFTDVPGGTASWTFTDTSGNYNDDSGSVEIVISKSTPTCGINGYIGVYDGESHGASGSCTGVKGETLTTLDLGDTFTNVPGGTANWTFADTSGNYNYDSGSVEIVITKADPICGISGYTGIYDGDPHGASGLCTGVKDETLTNLDLGGTFIDVPGGTASWTFADTSGNYNDDSGTAKVVITKADPTCLISGYTGVYDGDPHGASGSCTGVKAETLTTLDLGATYTDVPGGTANWTFTDSSGNYTDDSGSVEIVISKATPTCGISGYTGDYDGDPHGASGSCTGVKGETLTILDLGATFTDAPGGTANWSFADTSGNYTGDSGSVDIVITKAATTTTVTCPADVIYNGLALTPCTAGVTGPGGLDQSLTVTYENNINPGTATASASYAGDANYLPSSDSKTFTIVYMGESKITTARTKCGVYAAGEAPELPKLQFTITIDRRTGEASIKSIAPSTFLYYVTAVVPTDPSTLAITLENLEGFPAMGASVTLYDANCAKLSPQAAKVSIVDGNITIEFVPGEEGRIVYAAVSYTARSLRGQVVSGPPYPDIDYYFKAALDGTIYTITELYLEWKQ